MMKHFHAVLLLVGSGLIGPVCFAQNNPSKPPKVISVSGSYKGPGDFERGMQSTMYCGNGPESWVRGTASLDQSGRLSMIVQLETDSTSAGPKGRVTATLKDASGKGLATVTSDEIGMGGKPPGQSLIRNFSSSANVAQNIADKTRSMFVDAECTGALPGLWNGSGPVLGIDLKDVVNAFKIIVTALQ